MYLFVGLGNPGSNYQNTRHNMGFQVIDKLAKKWNIDLNKDDFHGIYAKTKFNNEDVILLKPLTFMNLSGQSVMELSYFYKISNENIVVIFDDMDTPVGKLRLREKGSAGGHNGMKSIIQMQHSEEIKRIKIGIGRPAIPVVDYVLSAPNSEERKLIDQAQDKAVTLIEAILTKGFHYALSRC